tara:strand:- start:3444 stop:3662 length:219 start_codon:yes stop_codon:yes gene_type:complete
MKKFLRKWMIFVKHFGNFQMNLLMTLIYFTLIPFYFIKLYFFEDPLKLKKPENSNWISKSEKNIVDNIGEQG